MIDSETPTEESINDIKCFPNPFTSSSTLEYSIKKSQFVRIIVRNKEGQELFELKNVSEHSSGTYQIKLDGFNLPSGSYFCTLETENNKVTKEIIKIK